MNFNQYFRHAILKKSSYLCVGIDPDPDKLPTGFSRDAEGIYGFAREVIQATQDFTPAYKFNLAFFELWGWKGWQIMEQLLADIPRDIFLIADAKRGDIGNSSKFYAKALLEELPFHAATVSPYLGSDSIRPFIENDAKGAFVLCVTSNASGKELQEHGAEKPLYIRTAEIVRELNTGGNLGLVVGATKPQQLLDLRRQFPELPFLIPGVGSQGGDVDTAVAVCRETGLGLINVSRGILYPTEGTFPDNIRERAGYYNQLFSNEEVR
ncbi:MAG TPA: orotidine-5'-phosphate decarboxylase [Candidatus Marinimicrobia bacterium]|nr:orotidine-5'-phosphate decarboxylase [Candidatus Neomarinimicrobiota bacterium]